MTARYTRDVVAANPNSVPSRFRSETNHFDRPMAQKILEIVKPVTSRQLSLGYAKLRNLFRRRACNEG
jgi:hypothetical protein